MYCIVLVTKKNPLYCFPLTISMDMLNLKYTHFNTFLSYSYFLETSVALNYVLCKLFKLIILCSSMFSFLFRLYCWFQRSFVMLLDSRVFVSFDVFSILIWLPVLLSVSCGGSTEDCKSWFYLASIAMGRSRIDFLIDCLGG